MLETEERLFDEFKRVDNICRDMFFGQSGISQYITEMEQNSFYGRSAVSSWDMDYHMLKRVRLLRNQIAHDSSATECSEEDADWLEEFHSRLLTQNDPLALLEKAKQERLRAQAMRVNKPKIDPKQNENRGIPAFTREADYEWLSSQTLYENKQNIAPKQNENRDTPLRKRKNSSLGILIMVLIVSVLLIGFAAAAVFLFLFG